MKRQEMLAILEEILEAEPKTFTGDEILADISAWDSLAVVNFIAVVDEELGMTLEPEKIMNCENINQLIALLDGHIE